MTPDGTHETLTTILDLVEKSDRIALVSHVNADGDAIGSCAALHDWLTRKDKTVTAILFEAPASRYAFLEFEDRMKCFDATDENLVAEIESSDLLFVLDLAMPERIPGWSEILDRYRGKVICIDHHPPPEHPLGDIRIIDSKAAATGELLHGLFNLDGGELSKRQALALYTAIATDTGWFRYTNTRPETMSLAAELLKTGIDPAEVFGYIYQGKALEDVRLTGRLAFETRSEMNGQLLWVSLPRQQPLHVDGSRWETDDLLDMLRSVKECRCVALIREEDDGVVRVNLRSKGNFHVNKLAERFGGGGHRKAAGITFRQARLDEVERRIVGAILPLLETGTAALECGGGGE